METSSTKVDLTYNQNGSLTKRTTNASGFKSEKDYHYENSQNPRLLTGITDENGVRYATWTYDDQGRAISSEHANGAEKVTLAYNDDGSTTVTNEYGKQATYRFQVIRTEAAGTAQARTITTDWHPTLFLPVQVSEPGRITRYQYDTEGRKTGETVIEN